MQNNSNLQRYLPFLAWPKLTLPLLKGELSAGITVGLMMIPQCVAYAAVAAAVPDAFTGLPRHDNQAADWVYFSFVTLTTVGYGDIVPVARSARTLAILEALVGQLYPAVIIARLVSLQGEK